MTRRRPNRAQIAQAMRDLQTLWRPPPNKKPRVASARPTFKTVNAQCITTPGARKGLA